MLPKVHISFCCVFAVNAKVKPWMTHSPANMIFMLRDLSMLNDANVSTISSHCRSIMPTTSTTDDITQRLFGELFQEMHVEMNPRQNSSSDKQSTSGTTLEADGVSSESSNMSDCPTPRYHALTPIKYGYLVKQGHNFRNWKVCERLDMLLCL